METRICRKCKQEKPLEQFSFKNKESGKRDSRCKTCKAEYLQQHYKKNTQLYKQRAFASNRKRKERNLRRITEYLKEHPCVDCGERDIVVLQFDHLRDKTCGVVLMAAQGWSWETVEAEIAKCEIRCANCHTRKTARTMGWKWKMGE